MKLSNDLFDNPIIGVLIIDNAGNIIHANAAFRAMVQYSEQELQTHTVFDLTVPEDLERSRSNLEDLAARRIEYYTINKRYIRKDGSILRARLVTVSLDDQRSMSLIENISTDTNNIEQELAIAYSQAMVYAKELAEEVKKRKMLAEELQLFVYIAAHDLQEPIRTAANYFQLLEHRHADIFTKDEESADCAKTVKESLTWATRLINSLLSYSRIEQLQAEVTMLNVCELLESVKSALSSLIAETKAVINIDCSPKLTIVVNAVHAHQIVQNLIHNALKYTNPPVEILIACEPDKDYIKFSIKDNGIGIEKRYQDLIFLPFKRLNKDRSGTGIGLAECKRIVELYNGRIGIESESGKGSTFYFTLPGLMIE